MAPLAESPILDTSGYMPTDSAITELKKALQLNHPQADTPSGRWISEKPQIVDSHDRPDQAEFGDHILQVSLSDLQELEDAIRYFEETQLPLCKVNAENFPLPSLSVKIRKMSTQLVDNQPYFIVRGLKPQWFSKIKNIILFMGIASHVATKRAAAAGDPVVLHHITNISVPREQDGTTIYRGPANRTIALPFHTDYGEILSLYTLSRAAAGGDFFLADIHDIVARIEKVRPDIIETLRDDWLMVNPKVLYGMDKRPLLFTLPSGRLAIQCSRSRLYGTPTRPRPDYLPPLSPKQVEAVDAVHVAGQEVKRRFALRSGDIIFFNNMRMMHARDGFVDGDECENTTKRYLLRLILKDERNDKWEIPPQMAETWEEIYGHEDEDEVVPIKEELFSYKAGH